MQTPRPSLPFLYLVTPEPENTKQFKPFIHQLEKSLISGIRLVQLRAKTLEPGLYKKLSIDVLACCQEHGAILMLNADPQLVNVTGAHGVHLDGTRLAAYRQRPLDPDKLVSAACHTVEQLKKSETLGANMVTLSPVLATASHPGAHPLGWEAFADMTAVTKLPVYALGGMTRQLLACAQKNGAYGIAGIRSFWCE